MIVTVQIELVNRSRTWSTNIEAPDAKGIMEIVDGIKQHGYHPKRSAMPWFLEEFPPSAIAQINVLSMERDALAKASLSIEVE